tara:strand:- start:285 stop:818 length:534 start_codon:yes stop_codon:yes gene_type:complete
MTQVKLTHPLAQTPYKAHPTDAGFDVNIVRLVKRVNDVHYFGTGVCICPPPGVFYLLFPRSSISKLGWTLANSVGVIDHEYRGEIIIALRQTSEQSDSLDFPYKIAQLVPFNTLPMTMNVTSEFSSETNRGTGGFGSTNCCMCGEGRTTIAPDQKFYCDPCKVKRNSGLNDPDRGNY